MAQPIEGRTVVITGAASGIGRALALGFLKDGAQVVGGDLAEASMADVATAGGLAMRCDVTKSSDVQGLVQAALAKTGRIDVLFNNAGIGGNTRIEDLQDGEFERYASVHVFGSIYGLRATLPVMRRQGYGRIVNTLSRGAEARAPGWAAYGAAKAALFAVTRVAAAEVSGVDVLVNGMIPGPTQSGMMKGDNLQQAEAVYPHALRLATLPAGGPNGKVFWGEREYRLFSEGEAK